MYLLRVKHVVLICSSMVHKLVRISLPEVGRKLVLHLPSKDAQQRKMATQIQVQKLFINV